MVSGLVSVEEDETLGSLSGNAGRQADRWTTRSSRDDERDE